MRAAREAATSATASAARPGERLGVMGAMPYPNARVQQSADRPPSPGAFWTRAMPGLVFVLLVLAVWGDPLFTHRNFAGRDLLPYNLPMEKAIHDAYARGEVPLWMPDVSGGRPLLPNPNAGALYPVRMLLSRVPFPVAMRIFPVLHWAAGGLGVVALLLSIGVSGPGAFLGAVTYAFSGVVVSEVFFPHILPGMALMPWVVWAVSRPMRSSLRLILLSVLLALDMLAGDVFTIGLALLCGAIWVLREEPPPERGKGLAVLFGAAALAALAALPQIVATALWIPETNRAVLGMKLREALQFSISPWRLLEFIVPYFLGATWTLDIPDVWGIRIFRDKLMGLFITLYAGSFAVIAAAVSWKSGRRGARFARALVLVTLALSVLPSLVPEGWRQWHSPVALRNPEKFAVALIFGVAILCGLALDSLRSREHPPRWALLAGVALAAVAVLAHRFPEEAGRLAIRLTRSAPGFAPIAIRQLPPALAEAGLLWMASVLGIGLLQSRRGPVAVAGLALLAAVPISANRRAAWSFPEADLFAPPAFARFIQKRDPDHRYRVAGESLYREHTPLDREASGNDPGFTEYVRRTWHEHTHSIWGIGTVFNADFDNGDLSRIESARRVSGVAAGFRDAGPYFGAASLKWGIRFRDQAPLPGYHRIGGDRLQDWDENDSALPDIRLASKWTEVASGVEALSRVSKAAPGEIVVETGERRQGSAPPGSVRVLQKSPTRLVLETDSPAPAWLFVLRGFWNHRRVRIDGGDADVYPAQLAFSAVPVPAGRHRVEWEERIPGWEISRFGPPLFLAAIGWIFVRGRLARARS
jgi:hypothetical protein